MPAAAPATFAAPLEIRLDQDVLVVRFPPSDVLSWAPYRGGAVRAEGTISLQVPKDARCGAYRPFDRTFRDLLAARGLGPEFVGFMTAASVADHGLEAFDSGPLRVRAVATAGTTNARSVLDAADRPLGDRCGEAKAGTVNVLVWTNALPSIAGRAEAVGVAAAAKAQALLDAGVTSPKSGRPAALTGTDCIAVASTGEVPDDHCGLHTSVGEGIGGTVYRAVRAALDRIR